MRVIYNSFLVCSLLGNIALLLKIEALKSKKASEPIIVSTILCQEEKKPLPIKKKKNYSTKNKYLTEPTYEREFEVDRD